MDELDGGRRCDRLEIDGTDVIACHGGKLHEGDIEAVRDFAAYLRGRGQGHQGKPYLEQMVEATLRDGFGDLTAPLADGEHISEIKQCPRDGCGWTLPIEWRDRSLTATRLRGLVETDALCREHMRRHEDATG